MESLFFPHRSVSFPKESIARVLWLLATSLAALFLGCTFLNETYGKVEVGRPQVFTRERLVKDRLREVQWLEKKLEEPFVSTYQGYVDQRSFVGLYEQLQASYSPIKGRLNDALLREDAASIARQSQLNDLDHNIRMLQAEAALNKLRRDIESGSHQADYKPSQRDGSEAPSGVTKEDLDAAIKATDEKIATLEKKVNEAKKDFLGLADITKIAPPTPASAEQTKANLTAVEKLNDEKAFREVVVAMMRKDQLDDTHDLFGSTLYDFKFDLSLVPGKYSSDYAEVRLEVKLPTLDPLLLVRDATRLYFEWVQHFELALAEEAIWEQQKLQSDSSDASYVRWIQYIDHYLYLLNQQTQLSQQDKAQRSLREKTQCHNPLTDEKASILDKRKALACAIKDKYMVLLSEKKKFLLDIQFPEPVNAFGKTFYFTPVKPNVPNFSNASEPEGSDLFVLKILQQMKLNVSAIEPREYVQNISDVAAREGLTNLVLALSASLPNGISADKYSQYMERSQEFLHAIKRQPLAMAFTDHGNNSFGWILGPRYTIDKSPVPFSRTSVAYYHTPIRHSFSVSIGVPAWAPYACLNGTYSWIGGAGQIVAGPFQLWKTNHKEHSVSASRKPQSNECENGSIRVDLLRDLSGLTQFLIGNNQNHRGPKIMPFESGTNRLVLENGRDNQTLVIHGKDIWRNPQVIVGSIPATSVELLHNMQGVIAHFKRFSVPQEKNPSETKLDLTVVTPFGKDTLREAVRIILPTLKGLPIGEVASSFAIRGKDLVVHIANLPQYYHSLTASIKPKGGLSASLKDPYHERLPGTFVWPLNFDNPTGFDPGKVQEMEVQVNFKGSPNDKVGSDIMGERKLFVYFKEESLSKPTLQTTNIKITRPKVGKTGNETMDMVDKELSIEIPGDPVEIFMKAYPGLQDALDGKRAKLRIQQSSQIFAQVPLILRGKNLIISPEVLAKEGRQISKTDTFSLDIEYLSTSLPLPVTGNLTLTLEVK